MRSSSAPSSPPRPSRGTSAPSRRPRCPSTRTWRRCRPARPSELISDGQHVVDFLVQEVALLLAHRDELPDLVVLFLDRQRHSFSLSSTSSVPISSSSTGPRSGAASSSFSCSSASCGALLAAPPGRFWISAMPRLQRPPPQLAHAVRGAHAPLGRGLHRDLASAAGARPRRPAASEQRCGVSARPSGEQAPGPRAARRRRAGPPGRLVRAARRAPRRRPRRPASDQGQQPASRPAAGARAPAAAAGRAAAPPAGSRGRARRRARAAAPRCAARSSRPPALDDQRAARPRAPPRSRSAPARGSSAFRYAALPAGVRDVVLGRGAPDQPLHGGGRLVQALRGRRRRRPPSGRCRGRARRAARRPAPCRPSSSSTSRLLRAAFWPASSWSKFTHHALGEAPQQARVRRR